MTALRKQAAEGSSATPIATGEFVFLREDFLQIARIVEADAGIQLTEAKATLVYSRLAKRLRVLGLRSFREYCDRLDGDQGVEEREHLLSAMTTNLTRFFREPHHFEHLKTEVLPALLAAARRGARVRLWSAAASTGQEPYSIAMTILTVIPEAATLDIKVLGTDIDTKVIAAGEQARYSESGMAGLSKEQRNRFFKLVPDGREPMWQGSPELRSMVSFRRLNLHGHWPMTGTFNAIFCRNVAIYFDEPSQQKIWSRFIPNLSPKGVLYIGHSERVTGPANGQFRTDGITTYRLNAGAAR